MPNFELRAHPAYLRLPPGAVPPDVSMLAPFRAVIIVDAAISSKWRSSVSSWLVRSGCLYTMAWGMDSTLWDDSVDMANIERFEFKDIPPDKFIMTTWHENAPLKEAFAFCKNHALHPTVDLPNTLLLHIAVADQSERMLQAYADA